MATQEREFQEKIRRLGTLVGELDQMPGGGSKVAVRELIQLLMEVHGTGLERIMEIVFDAGGEASGEAMIRRLGDDPVVRSLLLLYSLHPDDMETRIVKALENASVRLRKFDSTVELVDVRDGAVRLRLHTSGHACGSTTKNLQAIVEESVYDMAPDLSSLEVLGRDESADGFVPLEKLMRHTLPARVAQVAEMEGAD